jgi:membrane protein
MNQKLNFLINFITKGIWSIQARELNKRMASILKGIRIFILSVRGFTEDKIQLRASALTLYTLLSVVPIFALGFGIAKGFGMDAYLKKQLVNNLESNQEFLTKVIDFANNLLERTKGGLVAGIGLLILFWTVIKVFINIESSFNDIWQIKKSRSFARKFSDYLSLMFISPVLFISASASNVFIYETLHSVDDRVKIIGYVSPLIFFLLKLIPYFLIIVLFTLVYIIMPNTKVNFKAGLTGGIFAGIVFLLVQWIYVKGQIGVSQYNAIYGSFAALPLFIIWIQLSWQIVLLGAKISYSTQNIEMYEFETETIHMNDYSRRNLSIQIVHRIIDNFKEGLKPLTPKELSEELHIPIRMINAVLSDLVKCRILSEVITANPKITAFQPAQYIDRITVKFIIESLDRLGETYIAQEDSELTQKIITIQENMYKHMESHPDNILIKNL